MPLTLLPAPPIQKAIYISEAMRLIRREEDFYRNLNAYLHTNHYG